jgi:outer membrane protein assembly factor BamB
MRKLPIMSSRSIAALVIFSLCSAASLRAENWPQWRGPALNGSTTEKNLPTTWSTTENVAWATPMPGWSGATPVIWGDSIFVHSPDDDKNLNLLCINRRDGKIRWQKKLSEGNLEKGRNNMTSPSPVTDGKLVWSMFGTGVLTALDFDGNIKWQRDLAKEFGTLSVNWFYGSSPLFYKGRLYVQILQRDPADSYPHSTDGKDPKRESFILCLDAANGKTIWRHVRPTDAAAESQESYATPMPIEGKNGTQLVIVGGDYLTGHDIADGHELWRCGGLNPLPKSGAGMWMRIVPSPVVWGSMAVACGPKKQPLIAVRTDGKGTVTPAWQESDATPDSPTPALADGKLFVLDGNRKTLTCYKPDSGEQIWTGSVAAGSAPFYASPTVADGKVYCVNENGSIIVASAGPEFKVLSTITMDEKPVRASIVASNGQLFIRTAKNLYCIGKK